MKIDNILDELLSSIEKSDMYKNYDHIVKQVANSKDINELVNDIKRIQKELVKHNTSTLEKELELKKEELYSIPLYQDYLSSSEELHNMLKIIRDRLQACIDDLNI